MESNLNGNSHFESLKLKKLTRIGILSKRPRNGDLKVPACSYDNFRRGRMSGFGFGYSVSILAYIVEVSILEEFHKFGLEGISEL